MENLNLFDEETAPVTRTIRIRSIRPVYKTEIVREAAPGWVSIMCSSPETVFELFRDLARETKEYFVSLHLDTKNRILCYEVVSIGSLNASIVHPREVFKSALLSSAAALIFLHNHPSGDTRPSGEDIKITQRLKEAGELLGIRVLDHLIVCEEGYYSLVGGGHL